MKKLLLGTLVLLAFNAAIIITQMSCKKEAQAETPVVRPSLVLYIVYGKNPDNSTTSEIWACQIDGSNKKKLNITLPAGIRVGDNAKLTVDQRTVVFDTYELVSTNPYKAKDGGIYTCSSSGGTAQRIVEGNSQDNYYNTLQGAY